MVLIAIAVFWVFDERRVDDDAVQEPIPAATAVDPHTLREAQEGDAEAQVRIAKVLLFGGVQSGEQAGEAVRWLQSAAEKGHPGAMVMLGKLYRSGFGVLQDYGEALKWIRTAAERGHPDGMLELGRLYRDGVGMSRDPVLAYVWFNRAAAALQVDAVRHRADVARGLTADQLKEAQAQSLALEAGEAGAKLAQDNAK
nr:tetratricopeptide repeat protein [Aromatoleum petrolei]